MTVEVVTRWWVQLEGEATAVMESTVYEVDEEGTEHVVSISNEMPEGAREITDAAAGRLVARSQEAGKQAIADGRWPIPGMTV